MAGTGRSVQLQRSTDRLLFVMPLLFYPSATAQDTPQTVRNTV